MLYSCKDCFVACIFVTLLTVNRLITPAYKNKKNL
jgi:hypothetical protein